MVPDAVRPRANAAWGGRPADVRAVAAVPDDEPTPVAPPATVSLVDFASILLLVIGTLCGMVGASVWLHPAACLIVLWLTCLPVGLLLGWGERR